MSFPDTDQHPTTRDLYTAIGYTRVLSEADEDFLVFSDELDKQRFPFDPRQAMVYDVAGNESHFSLDRCGFQWYKHLGSMAAEQDFEDELKIETIYIPEMEKFLREVLKASHVTIFNHFVRREGCHPGPVPEFHLDSSIAFAQTLAQYYKTTRRLSHMNVREMHVNVWRPLRPVLNSHLALLDACTLVPDVDEIPLTFVSQNPRNPRRSTHYLRYSPWHRFFYRSEMGTEDVIIFKTFDSKVDGRARRVAHGSVKDPQVPENLCPGRASIELRAMVFFEGESRE
ncbi:unnamed protein product [Cercospora beticola]|nr:unnamed protein product [Cercospora beticola]